MDSLNFLDKSIFEIRELARGPKYLITGAVWDKLLLDSGEVPVKIVDHNKLYTRAGVFDTFILSYDLGPQESKIWINRDMPLPVRAHAYDSAGKLQYSYELVFKNEI
jgi:hypothetical protein